MLYLAACGVGTVTVIDDDTVETSNLHRQVIHTDAAVGETKVSSARREMLARNPGMTVYTVTDRLTADNAVDLLRGADVVLDGADNFAARYDASHGCTVLGIPHVWASILGFDAQLSVFGATLSDGSAGPVYEDVFPTPPPAGTVPSCSAAGVLGPVVGVVGTAMALEAVKCSPVSASRSPGSSATSTACPDAGSTFLRPPTPPLPPAFGTLRRRSPRISRWNPRTAAWTSPPVLQLPPALTVLPAPLVPPERPADLTDAVPSRTS